MKEQTPAEVTLEDTREHDDLARRVSDSGVLESSLWVIQLDGNVDIDVDSDISGDARQVLAAAENHPRFGEFARYPDLSDSSDDLDDVNELSYAILQETLTEFGWWKA